MSRRVWVTKVSLVLALDLALCAGGVALIHRYLSSRATAAEPPRAAVTPAAPREAFAPLVEVERPKVVRRHAHTPSSSGRTSGTVSGTSGTVSGTSGTVSGTPSGTTPIPPPPPTAGPETRPPPPDPATAATPADAAPAAAGPPVPEEPPDDPRADRVADAIRDAVTEHRAQIDICYQRIAKATTRTDPLRGTISVSLTIQPTGAVSDASVSDNDTGSDDLGTCLVSLLKGWRFPAPGGDDPIEFLWPFVFKGR